VLAAKSQYFPPPKFVRTGPKRAKNRPSRPPAPGAAAPGMDDKTTGANVLQNAQKQGGIFYEKQGKI
jgi:hypothetical protein